MKELQPLNENVLLEVSKQEAEEKTASGIIIPDSAKEQKSIAKVENIYGTNKPTSKTQNKYFIHFIF